MEQSGGSQGAGQSLAAGATSTGDKGYVSFQGTDYVVADQVFQQFGQKPKGKTCKAMQGLIAEGEEMIKEKADPAVRDAGLISAAQRVEHYEMAAYGTVRTYARQLGQQQAAQLLQQTLDEEGMTDKRLTMLAESTINLEAERAS